ncbi:MAG: M1 family aminopeptidase [Acidobacteriota bacterium]
MSGPQQRPRAIHTSLLLVLAFFLAHGAWAGPVDDWRLLLEELYLEPVAIPDEGIVLEIDAARLTLRSGTIALQTPLGSGTVVGFAFEGDGTLSLDVPDPVELVQLRRFMENEELEEIETSFDRLVLQTSLRAATELFGELLPERGGATQRLGWASQRHERWRKLYRRDPAARTLAALRNFEGRYFHADLRTRENDWLVVEYDDHRAEELILQSFETRGSFLTLFTKNPFPTLETWLSLDRAEDRSAEGSPARRPNHTVSLQHLDADIDLTKAGRYPRQGISGAHPMDAAMTLRPRLKARREGVGALRLQIAPRSRISNVRVGGKEARWIRYDTGAHDLSMDDRIANSEFVVFLEQPLFAGDEVEIEVETELELLDHAEGLSWYPIPVATDFEAHTAELDFRHRDRWGVITMGRRVSSELRNDGTRSTRYEVDGASAMIGFSFAEMSKISEAETVSGKPVRVFGTTRGLMTKKRLDTLSKDAVEILDYFEELFGGPIATEELVVGLVESGAQAFPGYVQLWNRVTIDGGAIGSNDHGFAEHFVAHELAHLWWGHQVGWASDRDYWLVEALAEYTAFLFVESEVERGDRVAERMLRAYTNSVTGSLKSRFDSFASWGLALGAMTGRDRAAPLVHGARARISEMPGGAYSTVYRKGLLILHMIRMRARAQTGSDEAFHEVLRTYLRRYAGKKPTTHDFQKVVEEHVEGDWQTFFDQWVDGAEVPRLRWQLGRLEEHVDGFRLPITVEVSDAAPDFAVDVPVLLTFEDGSEERRLLSARREQTLVLELDRRPEKVLFNEHFGVLSRMRDRDRGARSPRPTVPATSSSYER